MDPLAELPEAELRARRASSFGKRAAEYAEHRPDYPRAAVEWCCAPVRGRRPSRVLDLGAGTGKLTAALVGAGREVVAVEPDPAMRAEFARRVPGVRALDGTAEDLPLPDASVDAVLVGQAFHWFDPRAAMREAARVLAPGGVLAALWIALDDRVGWVADLADVAETGVRHGRLRGRGLPLHERFGPPERAEFAHATRRTAESVAAMVGTHSVMLVRDPAERAALLERVLAFLRTRPDGGAGEFVLPLTTIAARATRH
ncbi:Methylase involved in ubiquinone/menaquinone biosynthesis [Streptoalloteichus tenebrarius]|uniref:Methylase involved in ubiquinone/menaquinone biosynthesis n=1 Tax=Streptoalloteichus tenebrarius (strain ATCC 17920 / DSM 40477 / JCM 4838 / CBS 697.72 / NBRC 16177 / NCIMB 11028 / NRRL B-12390 / A12253. 1 / ISP 5477) TaxID=1933 RepID=A0ABT1I3B4_STRSD|nr:class I SAM-dependent methyltransferase [Streptoalloteichus tenebrarius]MCP2262281.1 Methylase involved in ubiquinone/menaquinone biosynthesis [Streptoalloteichus tenebrarius]